MMRAFIAGALTLTLTGCGGRPPASPVTLAVADQSNATPWIAADGAFVAVAWGASRDRKADVYLAVSRDGGRSFDSPVRVNSVPGEARLGGELPPRVALSARPNADPLITVLWTARGERIDVRTATSADGGKSFEPPRTPESPEAAGDRGCPFLALDSCGKPLAMWLDHRR